MKQGNLTINTQDIFPIIKKFLYTDHEIFMRELISNATDAIQKLKVLESKNDFVGELGDLTIQVKVDTKKKTLHIIDRGIGMTEQEVESYINKIAFSSAEEFIKKYEQSDSNTIIGHFGLGFYSSFMVSDKVEIITKSHVADAPAVKWQCSGSTEYKISPAKKNDRGTEIILYLSEESKEFADEYRIESMLEKYCSFMPIAIQFGTRKVKEVVEGKKDKDGNDKEVEVEKPKIINNTNPLWTKKPVDLTNQDYIDFYNELYPMSKPPLFWIHLNVDYPFNLTGVLYFPKLTNNFEVQKNKIRLFCNQVYVTDTVTDIVPEFLTLLHGVIDSPDIPLNVSRSALQSDGNVKKISSYIVKKVADRLLEIFKDNRQDFEEKWDDIGVFIKYGALTDEKFLEKAEGFTLLKDVDKQYFLIDEYKEKTKTLQTDKDKNLIWLYTNSIEEQLPYVEGVKKLGYSVLQLTDVLDSHYVGMLERKYDVQIKRVDAASADNLINKDEKKESVLSDSDIESLTAVYKEVLADDKTTIKTEALSPDAAPAIITQDEFDRRFKEMSQTGGGGGFMGMTDWPARFNLILNTNHPTAKRIIDMPEAEPKKLLAKQLYDIARLSRNELKGKDLNDFIARSLEMIMK